MTSPSLLIVDDIENNRVALTMRLELAGYNDVTTASNGREALERMREQKFDLVLLDIMMPEMDGYQVLEEMKVDTELRDIPVIIVSAVEELDSVVRCIELGAADYLTKPFNPTLLKARIAAYSERAQYKAQEADYVERMQAEKKRADDLLATLLPTQIARLLKAGNKLAPIRYDDVAVLFSDVVGFTAYSEIHPPETVFAQLEVLIQNFEDAASAHGMMKIKTIGDAFMATANLLEDLDDPVHSAVGCAFDMVVAAARHDANWQVRIGIDHGPVVAGIIGRTNLHFDVWGDTVNTASRIEGVGAPGTVNVSGRAWQHLRGRARGHSLGIVNLKGREPIEIVECKGLR
jgi:class 3 adenylate cyclase